MQRRKPLVRRTPLKRSGPVKKVADKRKSQLDEYYLLRGPFLNEHRECEICGKILEFKEKGSGKAHAEVTWWPVCGIKSKEVHHVVGRTGMLLLAMKDWLASCSSKPLNNGHQWLKAFPEAAMEIGLIKRRNT